MLAHITLSGTGRAAKMVHCLAIMASSVIMCGSLTSCARNSDDRDRDKILAIMHREWQAKLQAKQSEIRETQSGRSAPAAAAVPEQQLMEAARAGDSKMVGSLLQRGFDRKTLNHALLMATRSEPLVLSSDGQNTGQKDVDLSYAATAKMLLEKGASVDFRDEAGRTPLIAAAANGVTAVVRILLDKGARIEARDLAGRTALIAAACNCPIVDMPDTDDSVRMLLDHGANIEARDNHGETALIAAAEWGRSSIIHILVEREAKIEAGDNHGNTALHISARGQGYPTADAVQTLLKRGANIDARNDDGETPLMLAAGNGNSESVKIVTLLLSGGADVHAQDKLGRTALEMAAQQGRPEIVTMLRSASK
jgi:ankyrin repeat protein